MPSKSFKRLSVLLSLALAAASITSAQPQRKIIINEDASGPGGTNMQTILLLLKSPDADVLGITVVTGDGWRDENVLHTLRLLQLLGRTDVPVFAGANMPLVRTRSETAWLERRFGKISYKGAFDQPEHNTQLKEGPPTVKAAAEDAVHFLIRTVHQHPGEVTIYEGGPMTNLALAVTLDPEFASLARELVFMGGSLNPQSSDPEFTETPRHEFNFWFDPEAAAIVLRAAWKHITCTPVDISIRVRLLPDRVRNIAKSDSKAAQYVSRYYVPGEGFDFMWDELAAATWIDSSLITRSDTRYLTLNIEHGPNYGDTLTFASKPESLDAQPVQIVLDVDQPRFYRLFENAVTSK